MTVWLSAGIIFTLLSVAYILFKWGNLKVVGVMLSKNPNFYCHFIYLWFGCGLDHVPTHRICRLC